MRKPIFFLSVLLTCFFSARSQTITTIAGNGFFAYSGDGRQATLAQLYLPDGLVNDAAGNLYFADQNNHCVRKINASGVVTTIAGTGVAGFSGDGGAATLAKLKYPAGLALDGAGNVYVADQYNYRVRKITPAGIISTYAGVGMAGYFGDGGMATAAFFDRPVALTIDATGNMFIADYENSAIRKVTPLGIVSSVAGFGGAGFSGDGGAATLAQMDHPTGIAIDGAGNLLIADYNNHRIRKVTTSGIITTVVGSGTEGYAGDGGPATAAELGHPYAVIFASGSMFFSENANHCVRKVNASGVVSTVAGKGTDSYTGDGGAATAATVSFPQGISMDGGGNLYISDFNNTRIRKVTTAGIMSTYAGGVSNGVPATSHSMGAYSVATDGTGNVYVADADNNRICVVNAAGNVRTIAGYAHLHGKAHVHGSGSTPKGDGGPATAAELEFPTGVAVDGMGNVFFADQDNNAVRKIAPTGIITTIAGNGMSGYSGDGVPGTATSLFFPTDVAVDGSGNVYIADQSNNRVRMVNPAGIIFTIAGDGTAAYSGDGGAATAASVNRPTGLAVDKNGAVCIAEPYDNVVRKVDGGGLITTIAGNGLAGFAGDGGPATAARVNGPTDVAVDSSGNVFIVDRNNNRCRKINALGIINTNAGVGSYGFGGDGGAATAAQFRYPVGIAADNAGSIYVADYDNYRVRKVASSTPPRITGAQNICITSSSTLSNALPGGAWTSLNTSVATIGVTTGVVIPVSAGTATIVYDVSGNTVATTVTITPLPMAGTIAGPANVCAGASITLSTTATGGAWSASGTVVSVVAGVVNGLTPGTAVVSYSVTNVCGTDIAIRSITVDPLPVAGTLTGLADVCVGSVIALSSSEAGGVWSVSNTAASISGGVVTGMFAGRDTVSSTVATVCGTAVAKHVITVHASPVAGSISGPAAVCRGASVTLSAGVSGGVWSVRDTFAGVMGGVVTGIHAGVDTIVYSVTNFCGTDMAYHTITVDIAPGPITGSGGVCMGAAAAVSNSVSGGSWSSGNTAVFTVGAGSGAITAVAPGITAISYAMPSGCFAIRAVSVFPAPSAITVPARLCIDESIRLTNTFPYGVWTTSSTAVINIDAASGSVVPLGGGTASVTYTVHTGCTVTASFPVIVPPTVGSISGAATLCIDSVTALSVSSPGGAWGIRGGVASITASGIVKGLSAGEAVVYYGAGNTCGSDTALWYIDVKSCNHTGIAGVTGGIEQLSVFPNPSDGAFSILFTSTSLEKVAVDITDVLGRSVLRGSIAPNKALAVDMRLPPGMYVVRATSESGRYEVRAVIR